MKTVKKIWSIVLLLAAFLIVVDALVFFYIVSNPTDPLAQSLQQYEPIFQVLKKSELRSPDEEGAELQPRGVQITVRYVEGGQMVAIPKGHPIFAKPNLDAQIIAQNEEARNRAAIAERDGWYLLKFSFGNGWVHPFITEQYVAVEDEAEKNTATASRHSTQSDQVLLKPKPRKTDRVALDIGLPTFAERRRQRLQQIFGQFDSAELALLPTAADPERLSTAMDLMGNNLQKQQTGDFVLFYTDAKWGDRSAQLLANLRDVYEDLLHPAILDRQARSNAFVFLMPDMESYKDLYPAAISRGSTINAGHYEGGLMAIHPNSYRGQSRYRTLVHEAAHHYNFLLLRISGVPKLTWLDEGLATYFGFSRQGSDGLINPGNFPNLAAGQIRSSGGAVRGDSPEYRIRSVQQKLARFSNYLDIEYLLNLSNEAFYQNDIIDNYNRGWLFVHFVLHGENQAYRDKFFDFIAKARLNPMKLEDFEEIFGMKVKEFERRWRAYVRAL
jgi:hypothetical protein